MARTGKEGVIPGFLQKTYEIFNNPEFERCCGWGSRGESIIIKRIEEFSKEVLPRYFKHSNFQSFVRQLNMYDFHKVVQDPSNGEFSHRYFRKGRLDLLVNIKRKANYRDGTNKAKGRVVYGSAARSTKTTASHVGLDPNASVVYSDNITAESDKILEELVEQRMLREDMERRLAELEKRQEITEQQARVTEGENFILKKMVTDAKQMQFIMQDRMERIMGAMYRAYATGAIDAMPAGNHMISGRAAKSLSGMNTSSFHDVCGFLQLESPVTRDGKPTPKFGPQTTHALNSLISPPSTATSGGLNNKKTEQFRFDSDAGAVEPPLGFAQGGDAVIPLVELPETPAFDTEGASSSSSSGSNNNNKKRKVEEVSVEKGGPSPSSLTQTEAESLTLNTTKDNFTYGDFLKRARLNADSVTQAAREAHDKRQSDGQVEVPSSAIFDSLKKCQDNTLTRLDSIESTLENFLLLPDGDEDGDDELGTSV